MSTCSPLAEIEFKIVIDRKFIESSSNETIKYSPVNETKYRREIPMNWLIA
jgi:hypothetical protein